MRRGVLVEYWVVCSPLISPHTVAVSPICKYASLAESVCEFRETETNHRREKKSNARIFMVLVGPQCRPRDSALQQESAPIECSAVEHNHRHCGGLPGPALQHGENEGSRFLPGDGMAPRQGGPNLMSVFYCQIAREGRMGALRPAECGCKNVRPASYSHCR